MWTLAMAPLDARVSQSAGLAKTRFAAALGSRPYKIALFYVHARVEFNHWFGWS